MNETVGSYVLGKVHTVRMVGTAFEDFGNLGFTLDAAVAPGLTRVTRVTGQVHTGVNSSESIERYYDIHPTVNTNLGAQVSFRYSDWELNGIGENELTLFRSVNNGLTWTNEGYGSRDATTNTVTLANVNGFSIWTLGSTLNPLPVELIRYSARRQYENALLEWSTTQELEVAFYRLEVSTDGRSFTQLALVEPDEATSVSRNNYEYLDLTPNKQGLRYYRLSQTDLDGSVHHLGIRSVSFDEQQFVTVVYPNPFLNSFTAQISSPFDEQVMLMLFDGVGMLVEQKEVHLKTGDNKVEFLLGENRAAGTYLLQLQSNRNTEHLRLIKD